MQQVDYDVPYPRQVLVQTRLARLLRQRVFKYTPQQVRNGAQVGGVDADGAEGATCYVELVPQADVDVADLALGGAAAGPHGERFQQLLGGDEEMRDGLLDRGELLLRLLWYRLAYCWNLC